MGISDRLIYLAAEIQPKLPQNGLMRYVHQGDLLQKISHIGIQGASSDFDMPIDQLLSLYERGAQSGKGTREEFRILLSSQMLENLEAKRSDLAISEYLNLTKRIAEYASQEETTIIDNEIVDLSDPALFSNKAEQIPKWYTGFTPLDSITGGHYQSILMLIGRPGHGKTSIMISILESIIQTEAASSVWFIELEIPSKLMLYRISPTNQRIDFRKQKDFLMCGNYSIDDLMEKLKNDPDPERVIFIDSPDVMASGTGEDKRYILEEIYLKLIQLKWLCKAVIVSSWPRRKDAFISLESGAEAWAKAWYSDMIVGLTKLGQTRDGHHNVKLNIVKNRFGPSDQETTFQYDYNDLSWTYSGPAPEEDW